MCIIKKVGRNIIIKIQKKLPKIFPNYFCLVTGAPRSGTSAMVSWIGSQAWVKSFSETKHLFGAHHLRKSLRKWERFSEEEICRRVWQFAQNSYSQEGVHLGSRLLVDKEPLNPISLSPNEYGSFLDSVEAIFPSARFVFMVRDPVAVVSSIVNRKWGFSLRGKEAKSRTVEEGIAVWSDANRIVTTVAKSNNVYLCQFEELLERPENESEEIAQFLGFRNWSPFQPRETSKVTLSPDESQRVWEETRDCRERLADIGISYTPEKRS